MLPLLFECALRASLIAGGVALALWAMQIRTAAARHKAWTAVMLLMLVLPIWSAAGPKVSFRVLQAVPAASEIVPATPADRSPRHAQ